MRSRHYVNVDHTWAGCEGSPLLSVASPPVFSYYSNFVLGGDVERARVVMDIARHEFAVLSFFAFVQAASVGVYHTRDGCDPRL